MSMASLMSVVLGFFIGTYGTLVGAGGGFLLVPLFLLLYKMPHDTAVGTSIAVVAANAWSGAIRYVMQKKVDYRMGITFAIATIPGAFLGARLTDALSGAVFQRLFGVLLILISVYLVFRGNRKTDHTRPAVKTGWGIIRGEKVVGKEKVVFYYSEPLGLTISLFVGVLSSWLGIGGGILHVPLMTEWLQIPVHIATATSHFILAWTALVGFIVHSQRGNVDFTVALWICLGAIIGAQFGAFLSDRVCVCFFFTCINLYFE